MPNYQNGKIYSLRSHQTDDVYIGSTTQSLAMRKAGHVCAFKKWMKGRKNYMTSFEIIKYDDYYIELIENYHCNSKEELHKKEGEVIRETKNCVNKCIAGRSDKQYYEDNKERITEKHKQYYEDTKEKRKQYYQNNKEQKKQYYEDNKEILTEKFECECGGKYTYKHKQEHFKSKKHKKYNRCVSNNSE